VIGRGSFGKVYLVRKRDSGEAFAMKILRKDELIHKNLFEKTQAERDILQQVDCPYIVRLHYATTHAIMHPHAFQTETKLYFIIDFLNGGELFTYLR
jgi:serine/threonine protein kinase